MPRYIDAEIFGFINFKDRPDKSYADGIQTVMEFVDLLPTADVRENVRGKWVRITNYLAKCSVCEDYIDNAISCGYNYCPNCGAELSI